MSIAIWVICPICGAASLNAPPHGQQGQPCPDAWREQQRRDAANAAMIEKLNAERDYFLRGQMAVLDSSEMLKIMGDTMRQITDDDDE